MKLPILYHKAKGGDLRQWRVWHEKDTIYTEYGQVGGKLQTSSKKAVSKNVGRSNETTPESQAQAEAESLWRFKVKRKYSETKEDAQEELRLPMLAHKYEDKKKKVEFPAWVQPKLDGVRCLAEWSGNKILLTSRSGLPWNMPTVEEQLAKWLPKDMVLDGELYRHGMTCQQVTSLVKKWQPGSEKIIYNVYDVPVLDGEDGLTYADRLMMHSVKTSINVELVPGYNVKSHDEMILRYGEFMQEGYEGAILRLYHGRYLWGYRSSELLKVKEFQDAEFKVIGAKEGRGKMEGGIIWICQNDTNDETFDCTMKVTMDERRRMFAQNKKFIGKKLTVRFFDRTDDGVPRFPVGIVFRANEDL
jgi:DNA ligase-1